jgi:hypothetical protein
MIKPIQRLCLSALLLIAVGPATAMEVQVAGFGTASLSCFSNRDADYVLNDQPKGPGRSGKCDEGLDSVLGLQIDAQLTEGLEFGLQVASDRSEDRSFRPDVSLAQLRWRPAPETTVRLGRILTPAFLHAEDRQVRYAQPWVRPPVEVYGLLPLYSQDGLEVIHTGRLGAWGAEWQGGLTQLGFDSPMSNSRETYPVEARQANLSLTLRDENTLLKAGYSRNRVTVKQPSLDMLLDTLRLMGAPDLAADLAIDDSDAQQIAFGMRHERNRWLMMGEIAYRTLDGFFRDQYGAYVTVARYGGHWTPYATLAKRWTRGPETDKRAQALGPAMQAAVESVLASSRFDNTSFSLGLSRDISEQALLKLQADWTRPDRNSWGMYTNHAPEYDYAHPGSERLLTLSLDFVF